MENDMNDTEELTNTLYTADAINRTYLFLSQYVDSADGTALNRDIPHFKSAIRLLLEQTIFESKEDMRRECLREYSFILPEFLFPK